MCWLIFWNDITKRLFEPACSVDILEEGFYGSRVREEVWEVM